MLYTKPSDMSYSDIAIYIDKTDFNEMNKDTFAGYVYLLCSLIIGKRGLFKDDIDRDDFSIYVTNIIYQKYKKGNKPKSIMNYIKSIIDYKYADYRKEFWAENVTSSICPCAEYNQTANRIFFNGQSNDYELEDYLQRVSYLIKEKVNEYTKDENVLISCYLSYLNRIVLPNSSYEKLDRIERSGNIRDKAFKREMEKNKDKFKPVLFHTDKKELVNKIIEEVMTQLSSDLISHINEKYYESYSYMKDIKDDYALSIVKDDDDSEDYWLDNFDYD